MLRNRLIYLGVLLILVLFRIAYTGYVAGMMLLIALILPVFSWLVSLPGAIFTRVTLAAPDQVFRGSDAVIRLTLKQSRLFATGPARGLLSTRNAISGEVSAAKLTRALEGFPLDTAHCCVYEYTFRRFRLLDLMGLLPLPVKRPVGGTITVVPLPQEPPEHPDWAGASVLVAKPFTGGENPYDLRDYRTGDTVKAIHWKKSAALDKTVVRDTLEPAVRVASIWLDWTTDASARDEALDYLAWCIIYLKQNSAGVQVRWVDAQGQAQSFYATLGELDSVMPQMLRNPAGRRVPYAMLSAREILLSGTSGKEAGT